MKYIDIHCHLDSKDFDSDREEVLGRMREGGVGAITIGTDLESSKRAVEIAEANETISSLIDLIGNYDIEPGDFSRLANWGIYKNQPVIIDIGASTEVIQQHYK